MPRAYRVNYRSAINKLTQTTCDNVDCDDANKLWAFSCRLSRVCWQLYARLPTVARVSLTAVRSTVVTSLVGWSLVGHVRELWLNGALSAYWTVRGSTDPKFNGTNTISNYKASPITRDMGLVFTILVQFHTRLRPLVRFLRQITGVVNSRRWITFIAAVRLQHRVRRIVSYYCDLLFLVLVE